MKASRTVQGEGFATEKKGIDACLAEARRKHKEQGFKLDKAFTFKSKMQSGSWTVSVTVWGNR